MLVSGTQSQWLNLPCDSLASFSEMGKMCLVFISSAVDSRELCCCVTAGEAVDAGSACVFFR